MNKLISILISLIIILSCCACTTQDQKLNSIDFYYRSVEPGFGTREGIFTIETRQVPYSSEDYRLIVEEYLRGARIDGGVSPFPPGTSLVNLSVRASEVFIELSPHMALQSAADIIVCCACLCKTLFASQPIKNITVSIEQREINGQSSLTFDRNSFVNWDLLP